MARSLHRLAEERSLAYHRAVAERLAADPSLVERARARVRAWRQAGQPEPRYVEAWTELLARPLPELVAVLLRDDEEARALRQVTPFAGALPPRERWRIWREVRARWEAGEDEPRP